MEKNHEKINAHIKKYTITYILYWLAYAAILAIALFLDEPILLVSIAILAIIHILTKGVDLAELDIMLNDELFGKDSKDRTDEKEI